MPGAKACLCKTKTGQRKGETVKCTCGRVDRDRKREGKGKDAYVFMWEQGRKPGSVVYS